MYSTMARIQFSPGLVIDLSTTSATPIVASAILGITIVTAPSTLVTLIHVACDPLLGNDIGSVGPYDLWVSIFLLPRFFCGWEKLDGCWKSGGKIMYVSGATAVEDTLAAVLQKRANKAME